MFRTLILVLAVSSIAFAQEGPNVSYQVSGHASSMTWMDKGAPPVKGAPFSATTFTESLQTLADGTRIDQTYSGSMMRDSQGRTRRDAPLPAIGNLSATSAPHLVFIQDPVAGTSYVLNLTD